MPAPCSFCAHGQGARFAVVSPETSDEELLHRIAAGQQEAAGELFRRYQQPAFRVAVQRLGNDADAEDAVQEGFLRAFAAFHTFGGRSALKTWLLSIIRNAAANLGRRRAAEAKKKAGYRSVVKSSKPLNTADVMERIEVIDHILLECATLVEREIFSLRQDGLSYQEIANHFEGMTADAVRGIWRKVRRTLQEKLARLELSTP